MSPGTRKQAKRFNAQGMVVGSASSSECFISFLSNFIKKPSKMIMKWDKKHETISEA
jgi:flagellar biosynthesis chaperone FliJ